jgi:uncharacterized RDD family membrane protein YckC
MTSRDPTEAISLQGHYAGAATRLAAFAADQAIATGVFALVTAVLAWAIALVTAEEVTVRPAPWLTAIAFAGWLIVYYAYPWAVSGKTFGMALLGIQVVHADGSPTGVRSAVLRTLTLPLSFLTLGIGFLPIIFGRHRRALHDQLAGTAVVYSWDARAARLRFLARGRRDEPESELDGASNQERRPA